MEDVTSPDNFESEEVKEVIEKAYIENEKAFKVTKQAEGVNVELKHIPVELLALKELKNKKSFSKLQLESVIKT